MAKLPSTDKTNLWEASARLTLRFPWLIVLLFLVLCAASLRNTVHPLGIKNNTAELLSQDLLFQKVRLKLEKAFPEDAAAIIVVVESESPEYTALAAEHVRQRLQSRQQQFASVYIPDDNPFFRQRGFLYLDLEDLEALSDKLIDAQPFIGHLSQNCRVAGLGDIIVQALEAEDNPASMPLDPLLGAIDQALVKVKSKQTHYLSWQQLMHVSWHVYAITGAGLAIIYLFPYLPVVGKSVPSPLVCIVSMTAVAIYWQLQGLDCHLVCVSKDNDPKGELLEAAANKLRNAGGMQVIAKKMQGKPEQALCEYQETHAIDLTVMGAFSHTRIHDLLLGSFTAKMLRNTKKPLLLLR